MFKVINLINQIFSAWKLMWQTFSFFFDGQFDRCQGLSGSRTTKPFQKVSKELPNKFSSTDK
jgi:hypothetical protein